jgi:hypothetical protein
LDPERRPTVSPEHREDLAVALVLAEPVAADHQPIAGRCAEDERRGRPRTAW